MAAFLGTISEFSSTLESWTAYVERLVQYLAANKIEEPDQQRAVLLSVCGPATYRLIRNLVSPKKPHQCKFADIVEIVQKHHDPKPSVIVQRFRFNSRNRRAGESVATYIAELRHLAEHCEFGSTLNEMLRDRLVCGVEEPKIQRRLLAEPNLPFDKAFELALASESADKNAKDLQPMSSFTVNQVQHKKNCYRCGDKHSAADCKFKTAECRKCGKKGHIARACRSKTSTKELRPQRRSMQHATNNVTKDSEDYTMYNVSGVSVKPLKVTVRVNNADLDMEVDTGASVSIISEDTYNRLWPEKQQPSLQKSTITLRTYSGEQLSVKGSMAVDVQYKDQKAHLQLVVATGQGPSLLGRDWLSKIRIDWTELCNNHACYSLSLQDILDVNSSVFSPELGTLKDATATIQLDPSAQPRFCKARTVPYALKGKIEKELDRLVKQGVIEPISFSEWAAPIVPVLKKDGTVRICGDYKLSVNQASKIDSYPLPRIDDLFASLAERAVQTFKLGMKKQTNGTIQTKLSRFLFHCRLTPNATTGVAPAELMLNRQPRSHLDSIKPNLKGTVTQQQEKQKNQHDARSRVRTFKPGDLVLVRNFGRGANSSQWLPGVIKGSCTTNSYKIQLNHDHIVQRHADHIRARQGDCDIPSSEFDSDDALPFPATSQAANDSNQDSQPTLRCSQRNCRPPDRYQT